ncbi:MAG: thiamine diphosphokinase [Oscillospiraceae bacterium]|nr:thiamine diphosphokinase [Oscillospiraceae bacterium]
MSICYIVGAGECKKLDFTKKDGDIVIAADGGYKYLQRAGIKPDIVIGDFDSLGKAPEGEKIIRLKPEKDVTDTYAAVSEGIKCGYSRFNIYGASGGRIEHTLANIQLIASLAEKNMQASIFDGSTVITAVTAKTLRFDSAYNGYISIFAHSDKCTGVCLRGLKYPLENAELSNLFPLGVSNEFLGVESEIVIGNGTAIIVYSLPES